MLSREQAQALTRLTHLLRPAWNEEGIFASLGRVHERDAYEVALATLRAARDPKAKTPGVIPSPGPHWNESAPTEPEVKYEQPGKDETCSTCYQRHDICRSTWRTDHEFVPLTQVSARRSLAIDDARVEFAAVQSQLCRHKVDRQRVKCADCGRLELEAARVRTETQEPDTHDTEELA